jgi:hypothetical protein
MGKPNSKGANMNAIILLVLISYMVIGGVMAIVVLISLFLKLLTGILT